MQSNINWHVFFLAQIVVHSATKSVSCDASGDTQYRKCVVQAYMYRVSIKSNPPATFVVISAMRANFFMKFLRNC